MEPIIFYPNTSKVTPEPHSALLSPFGAHESQYCYGVFHEPQGHFMAEHAVLFVYPWGQDYVRCHRALRKVALKLQQRGIPSLRFDYRGTGDSGGADTALSMESAAEDIQAAFAYLQDQTGADHIQVVSVRFGMLATVKALANEAQVAEFLSWDPVLFGDDYINELYGPQITNRTVEPNMIWVNGYPMTRLFESEIRSSLVGVDTIAAPVVLFGAEESARFKAWHDQCLVSGVNVTLSHSVQPGQGSIWGDVNAIGGFMSSDPLLQSLEERLIHGVADS